MSGDARAALRRGVLLWAALLLVVLSAPVLTAPVLAEEEVLLSLPREFDVQAWSGGLRGGVRYSPLVLHFRGERVTGTARGEARNGNYRMVHTGEFRGSFRGGRLEGRHVVRFVDPRFRYRDDYVASGTAGPDGHLRLRFRLVSHEHEALDHEGGWRDITSEMESRTRCQVDDMPLQLPVGELQSSQELSAPPPARKRAEGSSVDSAGVAAGPGAAAGEDAMEDAKARAGGAPGADRSGSVPGRPGASGGDESPWSVPVTPGAAAGAGAVVALTSLLGALWMFGSSGLSPSDLLGSPPAETPDSIPPAPSPRELHVESHRDGEVNPDSGEVWSESAGGWVGANYHDIERRARAEVRRAQNESDRESRRESARIAREMRESRRRQASAARRGAQAEDEALRLEAVTIDPYQPGWTDDVTKGLEWAEWGADTSVSVLGAVTGPAGEKGAQVYTVAKETVKGLSEGVADYSRGQGGHAAEEGSAWVILERGAIGATKGAAKVGLDKAAGGLLDAGLDRAVAPAASRLSDLGGDAVTTVAHQLGGGGVREVRRSMGVAVGKAVAGSEMQRPIKDGVKNVSGESL